MADPSAFPDVRWGSESSLLRRPLIALSATNAGSWLIRCLTPLDRRLLMGSNGRFTILGPTGSPVLLLTTTGAKSGLPRTTPLIYLRDGDRLYVVGSNFGETRHPAWSTNLLGSPRAVVTMGGQQVPVVATLLAGPERDQVWSRFVALARAYDVYRGRTDRFLRVFALAPGFTVAS